MQANVLKPFVFIILMAVVSLACSLVTGSGEPTPELEPPPTDKPSVQEEPETQTDDSQSVREEPQTSDDNDNDSDFVLFTDKNELYSIEVPADWTYEQTVDAEDNDYYIDTFTSPDGGAVIENIVYDDGERFTGNQKSKFALYLLNTFYSSTGKEGDIRVSDDKIMPDGSERLTWTSEGGGYSGITFLEVRSNGTTFLLFTVNWGNSYEDQYVDTLNYVIESYSSP